MTERFCHCVPCCATFQCEGRMHSSQAVRTNHRNPSKTAEPRELYHVVAMMVHLVARWIQDRLIRLHSLNPLEDVLGLHPSHAGQMPAAMAAIAREGRGAVVLLRDTAMKLALDEEATPHKLRQYGLGAQILAALGLHKIELLTNSGTPNIVGLDAYGLAITGTRTIDKE